MIEMRWLIKKDGKKVLQYNEYEIDDQGDIGYGWQDVPEVNDSNDGSSDG